MQSQYKVVYTKAFNALLRKLNQQGHKKVVTAVRAVITEAGMSGDISSLPRTKHGETRLPNVEKYDLSDGFRLVVQLVDTEKHTRAFLFVGSHDDAQRWLDAHRNYRWVERPTDGTVEFVQVTAEESNRHIPADRLNLDTPEELVAQPLLRTLSGDDWATLSLAPKVEEFARSVTGNDYECDPEQLLTQLAQRTDDRTVDLLIDLFALANDGKWSELNSRIAVFANQARVIEGAEAADAMMLPSNTESFVTFDDLDELATFFSTNSLADWMLFLHPEQKKLVEREFRGTARLRGVSGSGKTSILVHRAKHLARTYREPILLVTLTESMRKLLDHLLDELCGIERTFVTTTTVSALAKQIILETYPASSIRVLTAAEQGALIDEAVRHMRKHTDFSATPMREMNDDALANFLREEQIYVRSRLLPDQFDKYINPQSFQRRGRRLALNAAARQVTLDAIRKYCDLFKSRRALDHEELVVEAYIAATSSSRSFKAVRCVLCDEVQDLSHLEIALLADMPSPFGEPMTTVKNGLFLAGDGTQTIYQKGFSLRQLGVDIAGRSYCLRKNYRNTFEILTAAFGLVSEYEFSDIDEDDIAKPSPPEFAKRRGARPRILRFDSLHEEVRGIASRVKSLLEYGETPGQVCVVGPSPTIRKEIAHALDDCGVTHIELRQDADFESEDVKISTIESAKGHEFGTVYIMGLVDGVLPRAGLSEAEMPREAARLYVAMTRARENLVLSCSPSSKYPPSRFLFAIQGYCDEERIQGI